MSEQNTIFDPLRKKRVAATPEELVRQKMIEHLSEKCGWPKTLMLSEVEISLSHMGESLQMPKFRCDIVCYNKQSEPQVIVECKAPHVKITTKTFEQIGRYCLILNTPWFIVTNGEKTYCANWSQTENKYIFTNELPKYRGRER